MKTTFKVGIIGIGFVGGAMEKSFIEKGLISNNLFCYDKYKRIGTLNSIINTNIVFLALPTPYDSVKKKYDKSAIYEVLKELNKFKYQGAIVIKSTVEPLTTETLQHKYKQLNLIHNPEFLTARTAYQDFHNQKHIVLGRSQLCNDKLFNNVINFYQLYYPDAEISKCTSNESECMKIFINSFYATKIQFFNELYLLSKQLNINYDITKNLMLKNGWISPYHTQVPGPDGKLSYGGLCFPKDTNALFQVMKLLNSPGQVLNAVINERNEMRKDNKNII